MHRQKEMIKIIVLISKGAFVNQDDGILAENKPYEK